MNKMEGANWEIDLLPEWQGEHEEEYSTIYHPNGVGALQISSYSKDEDVTEQDLKEFASEHIAAGAELTKIQTKNFLGFTFSFHENQDFWQHWYLYSGKTALLVTYNCEEVDREYEIDKIKQMVVSLGAT